MTDGFRRSRRRNLQVSDELKASMCDGKEAFHEKMARKVAENMRKRKANVTAYRCTVCKEWHIGSDYTPKKRG